MLKEKCPKPKSARHVRGSCTINKFGGEGRLGSPHLGPDAAATPQGRGGLFPQPRPSPPSLDSRDACGGRGGTGRSRGSCGKWRVREAGTRRAAVLSRLLASGRAAAALRGQGKKRGACGGAVAGY